MSDTKIVKLTKKDYESDQDVRWCPGCGDYAVLAAVQKTLAGLPVKREDHVFVSGIGCSSRFPYYMNTFGFHSIHGRAPAIATGLKLARPELTVWVITGDGDGLSIGGNHTLHLLRRNVTLKVLLFNNQIYGLTKGQYSPTSKAGIRSPSTPMGSIDYPINPILVALGAGASFVARVADTDAKLFGEVLTRAHAHPGTTFVEIMQNCPVFNDGVWEEVKDPANDAQVVLQEGQPLLFGKDKSKGIRMRPDFMPEIVKVGDGPDCVPLSQIAVHHEAANPAYAFMLGQMMWPEFPVPVGVLHAVHRPAYEDLAGAQIDAALAKKGKGDLKKLLYSGMTWEVGPDGVKQ